MPKETGVMQNRRRHPRVPVPGTAEMFVEGCWRGTYILEDLSAGGVLLVGERGLPIGTSLTVALDVVGERPLRLSGTVVRRESQHPSMSRVALAFENVSPDAQDRLQNAVLRALERAWRGATPTVLAVVETDVCERLLRGLTEIGSVGAWVPRPLELIQRLLLLDESAVAVVVSAELERICAALAWLATAHPEVRRIMLGGAPPETLVAHASLPIDWTRRELEVAVGISRSAEHDTVRAT